MVLLGVSPALMGRGPIREPPPPTLQRARYRAWFSAFPERGFPLSPRAPRLGAGSASGALLLSRVALSEDTGIEPSGEWSLLEVHGS